MVAPARKRTLQLFTDPFILAAIPTVALLFSVPVINQLYIPDLAGTAWFAENRYLNYHDPDGDGQPAGTRVTVTIKYRHEPVMIS